MNANWIITSFVIIDDLMTAHGHQSHCLAKVSDAEILTVAVVAAKYFNLHHQLTLKVLPELGYLSGAISPSRYNRRLHALADWFELILAILTSLFCTGDIFVIDRLPIPVCRRVRASRCKKLRGRIYCGYCAPKKEKFFGWRLHLVCTPQGLPVSFSLRPAALHDLTPLHELLWELPAGAKVLGDKGYNSAPDEASILADTGVRLIPIRKDNMEQHTWLDREALRLYRHSIETVNSQLEKMGIERIYARTNPGFEIKVFSVLLALCFSHSI